MNQQPPDQLLRSFERYLRATNRSERTVGNYQESLHQVEAFLHPRGVRLRDATRADLEEFLADLLARRSAATAATRYKVLRVLYRWLEEEGRPQPDGEDAPAAHPPSSRCR
jgi:integrase/recombinase XerC